MRSQFIKRIVDISKENKFNQQKFKNCYNHIRNCQQTFTTNYDILLYTVILNKKEDFQDGFGLGSNTECNKMRGPWEDGANCNIYYLHGAIHLFEKRKEVYKCISNQKKNKKLVEIIQSLIDEKMPPLFVAEGKSKDKLEKIRSSSYLTYCYQKLEKCSGNFLIFGHSILNDNDSHLYDKIFNSKNKKILYYCFHDSDKLDKIKESFAKYETRNESIKIEYVDVSQENIWEGNPQAICCKPVEEISF